MSCTARARYPCSTRLLNYNSFARRPGCNSHIALVGCLTCGLPQHCHVFLCSASTLPVECGCCGISQKPLLSCSWFSCRLLYRALPLTKGWAVAQSRGASLGIGWRYPCTACLLCGCRGRRSHTLVRHLVPVPVEVGRARLLLVSCCCMAAKGCSRGNNVFQSDRLCSGSTSVLLRLNEQGLL